MTNTNNSPHWTGSDMLDRIYGLAAADGLSVRHLDECAECGRVWAELSERRGALLAAPAAVRDEQLRAQRQAIWAEIERPRPMLVWRVMPAAAATAMLFVLGLALHQSPAPQVAPAQVAVVQPVSDAQFFTEIASVVNRESPGAVDPIRGLFADDAALEAQ